jgi:hypothetical protein
MDAVRVAGGSLSPRAVTWSVGRSVVPICTTSSSTGSPSTTIALRYA